MAVTIHNETWDWRDIHGVQIDGQARRVIDPDETDRAWALFATNFVPPTFLDQIARSWFMC